MNMGTSPPHQQEQLPTFFSQQIKVLILAGGKGTRLQDVTKGGISKGFVYLDKTDTIKGIDYILSVFRYLGLQDIYFCTYHFAAQYESYIRDKPYQVIKQAEASGTGGAVAESLEIMGDKHQVLLVCIDTFFNPHDIQKLIVNHRPGQITWGISNFRHPYLMEHDGLIINKNTGDIIGDTLLASAQEYQFRYYHTCFLRAGIQIFDPLLVKSSIAQYREANKEKVAFEHFWDVCSMLLIENRKRVDEGKTSIVKAVEFDYPIIDYGTPNRLSLTQEVFSEALKKGDIPSTIINEMRTMNDTGSLSCGGLLEQ